MEKQIELSDNAIKKAMTIMAKEIDGVTEIKQVSYIEESGNLSLDIAVTMKLGTTVFACAEQLQQRFVSQFKELFNLNVKNVNVSVKTLV